MRFLQRRGTAVGMVLFLASFAGVGSASGSGAVPPFAPFEEWKAAVLNSDSVALSRLYSTDPPALARVGPNAVADIAQEFRFWTGLKAAGLLDVNPKLLDAAVVQGNTRLLVRIEGVKANGGDRVVASMMQIWARQADRWRIVSTVRGGFNVAPVRRLPEPARPNASLYSDPSEGPAELHAALARAAKEHKRVIAVFGANWCYDCHVLDATFHSAPFAPLVDANYIVVHINIGEEGKDNGDLAARLGVVLDKGVPSLAVLDADGKVVVAQQGGEFESTVKIGPEDVRTFLEKWKPSPR